MRVSNMATAGRMGIGLFLVACGPDVALEPDVELVLGSSGPTTGYIAQSIEQGDTTVITRTVAIANGGNCPLSFTATPITASGGGWLTVAPAAGTIAPGPMPVTLTASIDVSSPTALLPGTYTGSIEIDGTCSTTGIQAIGAPARVSINITVTPSLARLAPSNPMDIEIDSTILDNNFAPLPPPTAARAFHSAVWTGRYAVVWGGTTTGAPEDALASGERWDQLGGGWTPVSGVLAPSARVNHCAVWTGSEMVIAGGLGTSGSPVSDTARYDPATDVWTPANNGNPPAAGCAFAWFENDSVWFVSEGGATYALDLGTNSWGIGQGIGPAGRGVFTGREAVGVRAGGIVVRRSAVEFDIYDIPQVALTSRIVWTGRLAIVSLDSATQNTLAINVENGAVTPLTDRPFEQVQGVVWTGNRMVVFGGAPMQAQLSAAAYDPAANTWTVIGGMAPTNAIGFSATWTVGGAVIVGGLTPGGAVAAASVLL